MVIGRNQMLLLGVKLDEFVKIGDIEIHVKRMDQFGNVQLAIDAPPECPILREKVFRKAMRTSPPTASRVLDRMRTAQKKAPVTQTHGAKEQNVGTY
jgi:sRNA-binding carbon storage regulator CsrA